VSHEDERITTCTVVALEHIPQRAAACVGRGGEDQQTTGVARPGSTAYEGRGWRGFHHHVTLCIAAYGFLIAERATIPPSGPRSATPFQAPRLPDHYRPRGSALAA